MSLIVQNQSKLKPEMKHTHPLSRNFIVFQSIVRLETFNRLIIGPLRTDVTIAMITKATNKRSSISSASLATVANIISIAPLAFKAKPMIADCLHDILLTLRPSVTPSTLHIHATKRTASTRFRSNDATKFVCSPIETK